MDFISVLIAFLDTLILDNARLYWYLPVNKPQLPYSGIRVELFPYMLRGLIDSPVISVIFRLYRKGPRFAAITGDRLIARLIQVGCTIDEIRGIHFQGQLIGLYDYTTRSISGWRDAEIAEIARHKAYFGDGTAVDVSSLSKAEQQQISGNYSLSRKYDIYTTTPFRELVEVKYGQAYVEDYTD